jgi:predicted site-specific integrase-resolvase
MTTDEDMVPAREAARRAGVTPTRVYQWIQEGALETEKSTRGKLVRPSAVRALAIVAATPPPPPAPVPVPVGSPEYLTVSLAAPIAGISRARLNYWAKVGKVATQPGRYGKLVRLADALAYAAAARERDGAAGP